MTLDLRNPRPQVNSISAKILLEFGVLGVQGLCRSLFGFGSGVPLRVPLEFVSGFL